MSLPQRSKQVKAELVKRIKLLTSNIIEDFKEIKDKDVQMDAYDLIVDELHHLILKLRRL